VFVVLDVVVVVVLPSRKVFEIEEVPWWEQEVAV
jgi:hypothetical protein